MLNALEYIRIYIDILLITSDRLFEDHNNRLDKVLNKLKHKGFMVNAKIPFSSEMS